MFKIYCFLFLLSFSSLFGQKTYEYPVAPKDSTTDSYFSSEIADPYQWMENPQDARLTSWLEAQRKMTKKLSSQQTRKLVLKSQIASIYNDVENEKVKGYVARKLSERSKYEFEYKDSRANRSRDLFYKRRGKSTFKILLKSKDFRRDKDDNILVTNRWVNEDEDLVAIGISRNGSDWRDVYFFDLATGEQLADSLNFLRAGSNIVWKGKDLYYDGYNSPPEGREFLDVAKGQTLYLHEFGTSQQTDKKRYQNPDPSGTNSFWFGKEEEHLFLYHHYTHGGTTYKALSYAVDSSGFFLKNILVYPNEDSTVISIESIKGDTVIMSTNWGAPKGRVLGIKLNEANQPFELVPEFDFVLQQVNKLGKNHFACIYRNDAQNLALIFNSKGEFVKRIDFPEGKKLNYFYENSDKVSYTDFSVSSFFHPPLWYQLSLDDFSFKQSMSLSVPYDPYSLETRYVNYPSADGTLVPMYITCLKNTKLNGKNPTLLYGYGGYGTTVEPHFNQSQALWLLHGGILAIPNIRGGGAEGSAWGIAGRRLKKQNAIDDFIAAAEFLIEEKYTDTDKLGIMGGSHGGLLVGAALTKRPELFQAAIADAGVFDMLRFEQFTIGKVALNLNEFGSVKVQEDFKNLHSYSPLHQIKLDVTYPNILLTTGDNDDRVPPHHSYKFLAQLQALADPQSLYHLYLIEGAGHSGALTQEAFEDELLYKYYFLFDQLGLKFN